MKEIFKMVFVAVFMSALVYCPAGFAEVPWDEKDDEIAADRETGSSDSGKVVAVDSGRNIISIVDENGEISSYFTQEDAVSGEEDMLKDINVGDKVSVDYYTADDRKIASGITVEEVSDEGGGKEAPPDKPMED